MNYEKLGNFEAICLIVVIFVNHIVLNLPQMILDNTGTASILNTIYILILVLIFAVLILKLLKKFKVGGQAVLGRQSAMTTPWVTERHG